MEGRPQKVGSGVCSTLAGSGTCTTHAALKRIRKSIHEGLEATVLEKQSMASAEILLVACDAKYPSNQRSSIRACRLHATPYSTSLLVVMKIDSLASPRYNAWWLEMDS